MVNQNNNSTTTKRSWTPRAGDTYYFVNDRAEAERARYCNIHTHMGRWMIGNCFETLKEAEQIADEIWQANKRTSTLKANHELATEMTRC